MATQTKLAFVIVQTIQIQKFSMMLGQRGGLFCLLQLLEVKF